MNPRLQEPPPPPELTSSIKQWLRHAEYHAGVLRNETGCGPDHPLDPRELARRRNVLIAHPHDIVALPEEDQENLMAVDAKVWSGMGVPLPGNRFLVLLHPGQTPERATVTIMEEVAHSYFRHNPSQIMTRSDGTVQRIYNERTEREAYWTAAAALLPRFVVARTVWRGLSIETLASEYHVSPDLVRFRIKITSLWSEHTRPLRGTKQAS